MSIIAIGFSSYQQLTLKERFVAIRFIDVNTCEEFCEMLPNEQCDVLLINFYNAPWTTELTPCLRAKAIFFPIYAYERFEYKPQWRKVIVAFAKQGGTRLLKLPLDIDEICTIADFLAAKPRRIQQLVPKPVAPKKLVLSNPTFMARSGNTIVSLYAPNSRLVIGDTSIKLERREVRLLNTLARYGRVQTRGALLRELRIPVSEEAADNIDKLASAINLRVCKACPEVPELIKGIWNNQGFTLAATIQSYAL